MKHVIFFGADRDILPFYVKNGFKITWVVYEEHQSIDDALYKVELKLTLKKGQPASKLIDSIETTGACKCVSFHDEYHDLAKETAELLGITSSIDNLANFYSLNKHLSRDISNEIFDIPVKYYLHPSESKTSFIDLNNFQFPVIVKPNTGTASESVEIFESQDLLTKYLTKRENVLIEEYIEGQEYSIETISFRGEHKVVMIAKKNLFNDSFVERRHEIGLDETNEIWDQISKKITEYLEAIGYYSGVSHIEVKLFNGKAAFIECQLRMGGGYIWYAYEKLTGKCLSEISYLLEEDDSFSLKKVPTTRSLTQAIIIEFKHAYQSGFKLIKWENLNKLPMLEEILYSKELCSIGNPLKSSFHRQIVVIIKGSPVGDELSIRMKHILSYVYPLFKFEEGRQ